MNMTYEAEERSTLADVKKLAGIFLALVLYTAGIVLTMVAVYNAVSQVQAYRGVWMAVLWFSTMPLMYTILKTFQVASSSTVAKVQFLRVVSFVIGRGIVVGLGLINGLTLNTGLILLLGSLLVAGPKSELLRLQESQAPPET
jgi:hypothetical protein